MLVTEVKPYLLPNTPSLVRLRDVKFRVAIDPGKQGALALLEGKKLIDVKDMPIRVEYGDMKLHYRKNVPYEKREEFKFIDAYAVYEIFYEWTKEYFVDEVIIEDVTVAFGTEMSKHAALILGQGFGIIEGAAASMGFAKPENFFTVLPSVWKREMGVTKDKKTSLEVARETWPELADKFFKRVKDNDRAEAALLGVYREITT